MATEDGHSIHRQVLDIHVYEQAGARTLQDRLSRVQHDHLEKVFQEVLDEFSPGPEETWIFPRLVLQVPPVSEEELETTFVQHVRDTLREQLKHLLSERGTGQEVVEKTDRVRYVSREERWLLALQHFLVTGELPVWMQRSGTSIQTIFSTLLKQVASGINTMIRKIGRNASVRKRIVWQFEDALVRELIRVLEPSEAGFILEYVDHLQRQHESEPLVQEDRERYRIATWELILSYLLADRGSLFNRKAFMRSVIGGLAATYNLSYSDWLQYLRQAIQLETIPFSLRESLPGLIRELWEEYTGTDSDSSVVREEDAEQDHAERDSAITYFLRHGSLPDLMTRKEWIRHWKKEADRDPIAFRKTLREVLGDPVHWKRVTHHIPPSVQRDWFRWWAGAKASSLEADAAEIQKRLKRIPVLRDHFQAWKRDTWFLLLRTLLQDPSGKRSASKALLKEGARWAGFSQKAWSSILVFAAADALVTSSLGTVLQEEVEKTTAVEQKHAGKGDDWAGLMIQWKAWDKTYRQRRGSHFQWHKHIEQGLLQWAKDHQRSYREVLGHSMMRIGRESLSPMLRSALLELYNKQEQRSEHWQSPVPENTEAPPFRWAAWVRHYLVTGQWEQIEGRPSLADFRQTWPTYVREHPLIWIHLWEDIRKSDPVLDQWQQWLPKDHIAKFIRSLAKEVYSAVELSRDAVSEALFAEQLQVYLKTGALPMAGTRRWFTEHLSLWIRERHPNWKQIIEALPREQHVRARHRLTQLLSEEEVTRIWKKPKAITSLDEILLETAVWDFLITGEPARGISLERIRQWLHEQGGNKLAEGVISLSPEERVAAMQRLHETVALETFSELLDQLYHWPEFWWEVWIQALDQKAWPTWIGEETTGRVMDFPRKQWDRDAKKVITRLAPQISTRAALLRLGKLLERKPFRKALETVFTPSESYPNPILAREEARYFIDAGMYYLRSGSWPWWAAEFNEASWWEQMQSRQIHRSPEWHKRVTRFLQSGASAQHLARQVSEPVQKHLVWLADRSSEKRGYVTYRIWLRTLETEQALQSRLPVGWRAMLRWYFLRGLRQAPLAWNTPEQVGVVWSQLATLFGIEVDVLVRHTLFHADRLPEVSASQFAWFKGQSGAFLPRIEEAAEHSALGDTEETIETNAPDSVSQKRKALWVFLTTGRTIIQGKAWSISEFALAWFDLLAADGSLWRLWLEQPGVRQRLATEFPTQVMEKTVSRLQPEQGERLLGLLEQMTGWAVRSGGTLFAQSFRSAFLSEWLFRMSLDPKQVQEASLEFWLREMLRILARMRIVSVETVAKELEEEQLPAVKTDSINQAKELEQQRRIEETEGFEPSEDDLEEEAEPDLEPEDDREFRYVPYAGLVLLWPFFSTLFERAGLMKGSVFNDKKAAYRATHLLYFTATGETQPEEHRLVLPKLLCGVRSTKPVEKNVQLTNEEKQLCEGLIGAAIQQWTIIKNTSVDGFRESFLDREGKLMEEDDRFNLDVEQKAFDMLLDQLPWSIGIIKLQWMRKPMYVAWR